MLIFGFIVGVFVGHVLLHPKRRESFLSSLDVNSVKNQQQPETPVITDGNTTSKSRRSAKD